ncbi:hypothetical protein TNCV_5012181 [Trichonephila clavipes]|nr:hypothetical protein TNCV_5012181 [Trichonephila clavipes]
MISRYIRGVRESERKDCDSEGAVDAPRRDIGLRVSSENRCEAPPVKRLIFEGALVRSLPRKNEENHEVCGIQIWSQRTLPTRWGITESE